MTVTMGPMFCGVLQVHAGHEWHGSANWWCPGYSNDIGFQPENKTEPAPPPSILSEADSIIHGDRNTSYGKYERECERIAGGWTLLLKEFLKDGEGIPPRFVPLMMIWLKVSRDAFRPKRDNRRDMAGYSGLLEEEFPAGDEE